MGNTVNDDARVGLGGIIVGGLLGLLCCALPLLVALVATDLAVFFASSGRVLTGALIALGGVVVLLVVRSRGRSFSGGTRARNSDDCSAATDRAQKELTR